MNNLEEIEKKLFNIKPSERNRVMCEAIKNAYRSSLYLTATKLLGYSDVKPETHSNIINNLESPTKRKLIVEPRGTFKSTIGVVSFSIWQIINNPDVTILIDSELFGNSTTYLREIKTHLESERLIRIFGEFKSKTWNEGEIIVKQRTVNKKEPTIMCGGVGTTKVGQHPYIIIGDDYNSPKNSATPEQRKKIIDHYQYNQAILDPNGVYIIIGTRYHEEDLIGWVIKNELGIENFRDKTSFNVLTKKNGVYYV